MFFLWYRFPKNEIYWTLESTLNWADDKQSKARNSDSKYRQMALVGFDT